MSAPPPEPRPTLHPPPEHRPTLHPPPEAKPTLEPPPEPKPTLEPPAEPEEPERIASDSTASVGPPLTLHAPLPSPSHVAAHRAGDEVVVRWEWPVDLSEVVLRWSLGERAWREKSISRGAYRSQGGAWLPVGQLATNGDRNAPLRIELIPVAPLEGRRARGEPVSVTVPARVEAWYEVTRTGPPWRRELTLAVRSGQDAHLGSLLVVLRRGTVMPLQATDGEVLRRLEDVRVTPDQPLRLRLPVPEGPYWLRCFAPGDEVELRDPPVVQLRGR